MLRCLMERTVCRDAYQGVKFEERNYSTVSADTVQYMRFAPPFPL